MQLCEIGNNIYTVLSLSWFVFWRSGWTQLEWKIYQANMNMHTLMKENWCYLVGRCLKDIERYKNFQKWLSLQEVIANYVAISELLEACVFKLL